MADTDHYRRLNRRLSLVVIGANAAGAVLLSFYFGYIRAGAPSYTASGLDMTIAVASVIVLFFLANLVSSRSSAPMIKWYRRALSGIEQGPAPLPLQRRALHFPLTSAGLGLIMWSVAGLLFAALISVGALQEQIDWAGLLALLFGFVGIAGPITAVVVYFAVERIWRPELPLFFAGQDLTSVSAFRLTIRRRLLVLNVMAAIPLVLLAVLGYAQAAAIARSPDPQAMLTGLRRLELFLVGSGLLLAVVLARTAGATIVEGLETLAHRLAAVGRGRLDERIVVTSNDELGTVSADFNQMADSLERRNLELQTLYQVSQDMTASLELPETLRAVLERVGSIVPYDAAEICLRDPDSDDLRVQAWAAGGHVEVDSPGHSYSSGEGLTGWIGVQRDSLLIPDLDAHSGPQPVSRRLPGDATMSSYLGVPLIVSARLVGTLELAGARPGAFDDRARQLLETLAAAAATAIDNAAQVLERERCLREQIERLQIEIDEAKTARQVAEITETEYFQELRARAAALREASESRSTEE